MSEERPISGFAQRFVARTLDRLTKQANKGAGLHYELFAQNFTDSVDRLAGRVTRPDLREHLLAEAARTGNYMTEEKQHGRWGYDVEAGDVRWQGEPLDWMKKVDFEGQWVRKSADERARYIVGHFGEDSRTQNDYPGIQVEKNGVVGPRRWGPEQPTGQDAQGYAENMLDKHLGFAAPRIIPSSIEDIHESRNLSRLLGREVHTRAYQRYIDESAAQRKSAAAKYGVTESTENELPPPRRSR
jgi:hypothetical protein